MGRPRHRVFVDPRPGGKETGYEIGGLPRRRDDHPQAIPVQHPYEIRFHVADVVFISEYQQIVPGTPYLGGVCLLYTSPSPRDS